MKSFGLENMCSRQKNLFSALLVQLFVAGAGHDIAVPLELQSCVVSGGLVLNELVHNGAQFVHIIGFVDQGQSSCGQRLSLNFCSDIT